MQSHVGKTGFGVGPAGGAAERLAQSKFDNKRTQRRRRLPSLSIYATERFSSWRVAPIHNAVPHRFMHRILIAMISPPWIDAPQFRP